MKPITVNDTVIDVGINLEAAFRHMQYNDIEPAIWVDSVCINQKDLDEKNDQVPRMRSIYASARQVLIWLGPETEHSELVADTLLRFSRLLERRYDIPFPLREEILDDLDFSTNPSDSMDVLRILAEEMTNAETRFSWADLVVAIGAFAASTAWFFRVWTVQEFVLAKTYFFQVGLRKLGTVELATFLAFYIHSGVRGIPMSELIRFSEGNASAPAFNGLSVQWVMEMASYRSRYRRDRSRWGLYELLCRTYCQHSPLQTNTLDSTDPRDRIYGLLGIVGNLDATNIPVRYDSPTHEVFVDIAKRLYLAGKLDILALCQKWQQVNTMQHSESPKTDDFNPSKLPSWAPDWTSFILIPHTWWKVGQNGSDILGNGLFSAAANTNQLISFVEVDDATQGDVRHKMIVRGMEVDEIMAVKSKYCRSQLSEPTDMMLVCQNILEEIQSLCEAYQRLGCNVYDEIQFEEAAWRIPISDHEPKESDGMRRATNQSRDRYRELKSTFEALLPPSEPQAARSNREVFAAIMAYNPSGVQTYLVSMTTGTPIRPFITKRGYIGIGPVTMEPGDTVCLLFGARVPHIIRRRRRGQAGYTLLGQAYVHGVMDGELLRTAKHAQDFEIF